MTLSQKALRHLVAKAAEQHEQARVMVARSSQAMRKAAATKSTLEKFVEERNQSRRAQSGSLISVNTLRIASGFSQKLDRAVVSQAQSLAGMSNAHRANMETLTVTRQNLEIMQSLQENLQREIRDKQELAEQRETDEMAARLSMSRMKSLSTIWI